MDNAFFGTKYFAISLGIAVAIVAGAAGAYQLANVAGARGWSDGCDAPSLTGRAITIEPETTTEQDGERRVQTYILDAAEYAGGTLDLCLSVGEIYVENSTGSQVELEILTSAHRAAAVDATHVPVSMRAEGSRLAIGVWESARGETGGWFDDNGARVRIVLRIPASGEYDVTLHNDVGDIRLTGLLVGELVARTDVGDVIIKEVDLAGSVSLKTDVGDAILGALSVQGGNITLRADVGNVEASLPQRADVGYDAHATTDVGHALVRIGDTEEFTTESDGPGGEQSARTAGFAEKPTKVVVRVSSNVGDARITAD